MRKSALMSAISAVLIMTSQVVFAAELDVEKSGNVYTVKTDITANTDAILLAVEKGADIADNDNIFAMVQATSGDNGEVTFNFEIPETKDAAEVYKEFELFVKTENTDVLTGEFAFAKAQKKTDAITRIQSELLSSGTTAATFAETDSYAIAYKAMELDIARFNSYIDMTVPNACVQIFNSNVTPDGLDEEKLKIGFNKSLAMAEIGNGISAKNAMKTLNYTFEGTAYNDISDTGLISYIDDFYAVNKTYSTFEELDASYRTANILYKIDAARFDALETLLSTYKTVLNIEANEAYAAYNSLTSKSTANDTMVAYFNRIPCNTIQILLDGIKAGVDASISGGSTDDKDYITNGGIPVYTPSTNSGGGGQGNFGVQSPVVTAPTEPTGIKDMNQAEWAKEAVTYLYEAGIVSGDENSEFNPNNEMTREEFVTMIVVAKDIYDENAVCDFDDVDITKWYASYVASAVNNDIIAGMGDNKFGIELPITRQDMMTVIYRAFKDEIQVTEEKTAPSDYDEIAEYAQIPVMTLYQSGIVSGMDDGRIVPEGTATKAQCAMILYNILKNI